MLLPQGFFQVGAVMAMCTGCVVVATASDPHPKGSKTVKRVEMPSTHMTVGYRSVHPTQGRQYNEHNTLLMDTRFNDGTLEDAWDDQDADPYDWYESEAGAEDLGNGVYTTPAPGQWLTPPHYWHCHIAANKEALKNINKLWVPYDLLSLAWEDGPVDDLAKKHGLEPKTTIRMALILAYEPETLQLLIPAALVPGDEFGLDWVVTCENNIEDLPITDEVDYTTWDNVVGDVQVPQPAPTDAAGPEI